VAALVQAQVSIWNRQFVSSYLDSPLTLVLNPQFQLFEPVYPKMDFGQVVVAISTPGRAKEPWSFSSSESRSL
jgi:hypothetical protein